ncbi:MAG: RNA polymerase sigma factor [Spirochaetales bacterium]|nr:RNA polymerase sigma factor [Spirochaetales bacterium]
MDFGNDFIKRLKKKETAAFEELYRLTRHDVFNYIKYKVNGNAGLAEDLLSEVYCRAIEYAHTLNPNPNHNVTGWLIRIAQSKVIDHYRRMKRENRMIVVQSAAAGHTAVLNMLSNPPESSLLEKEDGLIVSIGFSRLSSVYQQALSLKYIDEKSVSEIAAITGRTEKAVENMLYRGRKMLERELERAAKEKIYCFREGGEAYESA